MVVALGLYLRVHIIPTCVFVRNENGPLQAAQGGTACDFL